MSPFSCQAKRDIKYFPSRARRDRSGGKPEHLRETRQRKRERECEREREKRRGKSVYRERMENREIITV